jgi:UDP-glucuronate 4-epimerase
MKILVTGGAGFIGSNLCIKLLGEGHQIRVLDDLSNGSTANLDLNQIDFIEGSILDISLLGKAVRDVDAVVHLAALGSVPRSIQDPRSSIEVNFTGTLNVLEALKDRKTPMIFSSSSSLYGESKVLPRVETTAAEPRSPYAVSKLAAESLVSAYYHSYGIPTLSFRFFNVYGPRQSFGHPYAAAIPIFFESLLKEEPIKIFGDGEQVRDFTYVDDIVESICRLVPLAPERNQSWDAYNAPTPSSSAPFRVLNIGNSNPVPLSSYVGAIELELGIESKKNLMPMQPGDVPATHADCSSLETITGYRPQVKVEEGVKEFVRWYRGFYKL